ncbi:MAG: carboxypeptidase-like regulatory domain-containing protein [Bacteroidota bacterium]
MILNLHLPKPPVLVGVLLTLFLFLTISLQAQYRISGTITDEAAGSPLIGVNVYELGRPTQGTVTDFDGKYELEVSTLEGTLVMSYIGFQDREVSIDGRNAVDIIMTEGVALEEVVVTALGYAVQTVDSEALNNVRAGNNMLDGLTGKVADLQTTSASNGLTSSNRLVIRGESSLNINDNSPLIVVDGIPINNNIFGVGGGNTDQSNLPTDYGNGAAEINPKDIESVSVLKGAAASALYGSRAVNGVILITTKSDAGKWFFD